MYDKSGSQFFLGGYYVWSPPRYRTLAALGHNLYIGPTPSVEPMSTKAGYRTMLRSSSDDPPSHAYGTIVFFLRIICFREGCMLQYSVGSITLFSDL